MVSEVYINIYNYYNTLLHLSDLRFFNIDFWYAFLYERRWFCKKRGSKVRKSGIEKVKSSGTQLYVTSVKGVTGLRVAYPKGIRGCNGERLLAKG